MTDLAVFAMAVALAGVAVVGCALIAFGLVLALDALSAFRGR